MSIDQLKATISKKGGLSQANRFNVMFTPPQGSLLNSDPATLIGGLASGGGLSNVVNDPRDISLLAESVNLPSSQITTLDHIAEKQSVKIPYAVIQEEVTMTFLLTNDYYIKNMFDKWGQSIIDLETYRVAYKKDIVTDVVIQQLNKQNIPIYGVKLENAFPTTIGGVALSNESADTPNKLTVTFSYDKYIVEDGLTSAISGVGAALGL
tara:strand:- start:698 stop:1324 length:627 start_codon:yes stop_codon:yes gene_type:complete